MDDKNNTSAKRRTVARRDSTDSYQKRRREITDAAVHVFDKLGYKGGSLSAVAAALGIDRATLYYYFASKEQLFDEIIRSVVEGNDDLAKRIANSPVRPARKLREVISALMMSYAAHYPLLFIYIREDLSHVSDRRSDWSKYMRNLNRSIEKSVIEIIEQGYADGSLRRIGSARTVAYAILGMLNWSHRWFNPERSESPEEIGKTFAEFALAGLEPLYVSSQGD